YLLPLEKTAVSGHLSYFCGPTTRPIYQIPPANSDYGPPDLKRSADETDVWAAANLANVLPNARLPANSRKGNADELYVRMNSFPSELYVLTVPGAVHLRLAPGGSFVPNLYLAGDWTRNGYDIGAFEVAVLSGLLCARAITG